MRQSQSLDQQVGELFEERPSKARRWSNRKLVASVVRELGRRESIAEFDSAVKGVRVHKDYRAWASDHLDYLRVQGVPCDQSKEAVLLEELVDRYAALRGRREEAPSVLSYLGERYAWSALAGLLIGSLVWGLPAMIAAMDPAELQLSATYHAVVGSLTVGCFAWPLPAAGYARARNVLSSLSAPRRVKGIAIEALDRYDALGVKG